MFRFYIDTISVKTADGILSIVPKKINVLVGPNNLEKVVYCEKFVTTFLEICQVLKCWMRFNTRFQKTCLNWMRPTISQIK